MKQEIVSSWNTLFEGRKLSGNVIIPDSIPKVYKNGTADWIGPKKGDTSPILYVSSIAGGNEWDDVQFEKLTGIKNKCYSYAYCGQTSPLAQKRHIRYLTATFKRDINVFLDSGAHSLHRMLRSGKTLAKRINVPKERRFEFVEFLSDKFLELYAEYVKWSYAKGRYFTFYVTLDSRKDCKLIWENTKKLQKLGIWPTSVYHGDQGLDWIKRYADDGHKFICIGISQQVKGNDTRRRYYDNVFKTTDKLGMKCHGLALTGDKMLAYPWHCLTDTHEILTQRGWLKREDLSLEDFVLTLRPNTSPKTARSEWKQIKKIYEYDVIKAPIQKHFKNKFHAEVTYNHRWLVWKKFSRSNKYEWRWETTDQLTERSHIPRSAKYADAPTYKKYPDDLVRLIAWIWTDGSISYQTKSDRFFPIINIYQSIIANPEKVNMILDLLKRLNIGYNISKDSKKGVWCFQLNKHKWSKWALRILKIPKVLDFNFILKLTKSQLKIFIKTAVLGDGTVGRLTRGPQTFTFGQNRGKGMEAFKMACVLAGIPITSSCVNLKKESVVASNKRFAGRDAHADDVLYTGKLWCISVENQTFMTRCNGTYYWTGNSVDSATHIKAGSFGKILAIIPERQRMAQIHISKTYSKFTPYGNAKVLSSAAIKNIRDVVEKNGFDFERLKTDITYRIIYNARILQQAVENNKRHEMKFTTWEALV